MAKKVRVVLNRKAFGTEVLHKAVKPVMDDVQEQVEGMQGSWTIPLRRSAVWPIWERRNLTRLTMKTS